MDYEKKNKEAVEKVCGTCTYWQEGTLDRGMCQAGEPHQTHSAETCDMWEQHEEIPIKEQPSEDLEEAESLLPEPYGFLQTDIYGGSESVYSREQMLAILKAGIEWQKKQMLKDAVEGEIVKDISNKLAVTAKVNLEGFKFGQKVKIVIVKEGKK